MVDHETITEGITELITCGRFEIEAARTALRLSQVRLDVLDPEKE